MMDQKNFSIGACTLVPQITRPSCARDIIVDKVQEMCKLYCVHLLMMREFHNNNDTIASY